MKHKQPTYWQKYDQVFKRFSYKKIYEMIHGLAMKLGEPFSKQGTRGPKLKLPSITYASFIAFEIITGDAHFRDMEQDAELFVIKHIDHSTFQRNFEKIPYEYLQHLLQACAALLESLLGTATAYIPDSTAVTTRRYHDIMYRGKIRRVKQTYKSHALVGYYPDKGVIYVKTAEGADHHVSDSAGAVSMLDDYDLGWAYLPADRGYDYERVYRAAEEAGLTSIIKKQKRKNGRKSKCRKRSMYREPFYRHLRHPVENNFGGLENKGMLVTSLRKPENIAKYSVIIHLRQTLFAYLRQTVLGLIDSIMRQTRVNNKF